MVNLSQNNLRRIKAINRNLYFHQCSSRCFTFKCLKQNILRQKEIIFRYKMFNSFNICRLTVSSKVLFICLLFSGKLLCLFFHEFCLEGALSFVSKIMCVFQFCFQEQFLSRVAISASYKYSFELTVCIIMAFLIISD